MLADTFRDEVSKYSKLLSPTIWIFSTTEAESDPKIPEGEQLRKFKIALDVTAAKLRCSELGADSVFEFDGISPERQDQEVLLREKSNAYDIVFTMTTNTNPWGHKLSHGEKGYLSDRTRQLRSLFALPEHPKRLCDSDSVVDEATKARLEAEKKNQLRPEVTINRELKVAGGTLGMVWDPQAKLLTVFGDIDDVSKEPVGEELARFDLKMDHLKYGKLHWWLVKLRVVHELDVNVPSQLAFTSQTELAEAVEECTPFCPYHERYGITPEPTFLERAQIRFGKLVQSCQLPFSKTESL